MESPVLFQRVAETVAVVTLNRVDRLNAVNLDLYRALGPILDQCQSDATVRSVVLTGAGRAFCVGADLKAHGNDKMSESARREYVETGQAVYRKLQELTKPVVAAVNGHAIGAGLEMALSCDFIVVADEAKLRFPEIGLGTFVGGGVTYTLAQRVGLGRARELIMLGDFFSGAAALEMGLATRCVPASDVLMTAEDLARELASKAPVSMSHAKRLLGAARRLDTSAALRDEMDALLDCMGTDDWVEGVQAFSEKRDPVFKGK